jgi:hypothetical protein
MEACQPPFSARAVAAMSRQTDAGELVPIRVLCMVFGISHPSPCRSSITSRTGRRWPPLALWPLHGLLCGLRGDHLTKS